MLPFSIIISLNLSYFLKLAQKQLQNLKEVMSYEGIKNACVLNKIIGGKKHVKYTTI